MFADLNYISISRTLIRIIKKNIIYLCSYTKNELIRGTGIYILFVANSWTMLKMILKKFAFSENFWSLFFAMDQMVYGGCE